MKFAFSSIVTFTLQKLKAKLKILKHSFHNIALGKDTVFEKHMLIFLQKKNAETNQNKRILVLKGIFSGTKYVCGLIYQISSFQHTHNEIYTRLILPTPTSHHYHCYPSNHRKTNI